MIPKKKIWLNPGKKNTYIKLFILHYISIKYYFFINFYYSPKSFLPPSVYMSKEVKK